MLSKKNIEEAKRWYEAAQDDLDTAGILMIHKKYNHTCFHAQQSVLKALKAIWHLNNTDPGGKIASKLIRELQVVDNVTFSKLEKFINDAEKLDRCASPGILPGKEFDKENSDFFINTAYKILAEVKAILKRTGISINP